MAEPSGDGGNAGARVWFAGSARESRANSVERFLDDGGRLCGSADLRHRFVFGGGAGGWIVGGISLVNRSDFPCALRGPLRFVGLDSQGGAVTTVSTCDEMVLKHQSCAAPIVLFPAGTAQRQEHPSAISVRLYGWSRGGGPRAGGCPSRRIVSPATLRLSLGDLTFRLLNRDTAGAARGDMWGCGNVVIAGGPRARG
jgi:hypothetical protein